jgi:hypothetical protein
MPPPHPYGLPLSQGPAESVPGIPLVLPLRAARRARRDARVCRTACPDPSGKGNLSPQAQQPQKFIAADPTHPRCETRREVFLSKPCRDARSGACSMSLHVSTTPASTSLDSTYKAETELSHSSQPSYSLNLRFARPRDIWGKSRTP